MFSNYKTVSCLSKEEEKVLIEYIEEQEERKGLEKLVEQKSEEVAVLYRGTRLPIGAIEISNTYQRHTFNSLSSWTKNREVAEGFAFSDNLEITENTIPVILKCYEEKGFVVNNHIIHQEFIAEEEVICCGSWVITHFEEKYTTTGKGYLEAIVKKA